MFVPHQNVPQYGTQPQFGQPQPMGVQQQPSETVINNLPPASKPPKHPIVFVFHVLFKALAILIYWIGGLITKSFVIRFVLCIVFLAADFWVTKNVTGRFLVGLRWWNETNSTGGSAWRFETVHQGSREINPAEKKSFWTANLISTAHWCVALFFAVFSFSKYILLACVGILFNASNLYGYFKCSREAQDDLSALMSKGSNSLLQTAIKHQFNSATQGSSTGRA